jgi:hypothetical protein
MERHAQKGDKRVFFINMTTVLLMSGLFGRHAGAFSGSWAPSPDRSPVSRPPKWLDRHIIPVNCGVHASRLAGRYI